MPDQMALVLRDTEDADKAIYTVNQLIYTATPIFVGMDDPVPERILYREGTLLRPRILEPESRSRLLYNKQNTAHKIQGKGYQYYRGLIGKGRIYEPLKKAVASYYSTTKEPDPVWLEKDLAKAIKAKAHLREPQYIQFRLLDLPKLINAISCKQELSTSIRRNNINELRKNLGL